MRSSLARYLLRQRDFTLRQRLGIGLAILVLSLLLLTFSGYLLFQHTINLMEEVMEQFVPVSTLQEVLLRAVMPANDYLIYGDRDERQKFQSLRAKVDEGFKRALGIKFTEPRKHATVARAQQMWMEVERLSDQLLLMENPRESKDGVALIGRVNKQVNEAYNLLEYVCAANQSELENNHRLVHQVSVNIRTTVLVFLALVSLAALIGSMLIRRWIIAPLNELEDGTRQLMDGHLDYRIPVRKKDEIGSVASSFNEMADALKHDRDTLRNLSMHDPLTGMFNRREFRRIFDVELERSRRYGHTLALILIDIDYFKMINDRHGHMAGDRILINIAKIISSALRPIDIIARYGGEEFIILLPEIDAAGAIASADRLCAMIGGKPVKIDKNIHQTVTISVGVAVYPADGRSAEPLITAADKALYAAKNAGRNRYCNFADLRTQA